MPNYGGGYHRYDANSRGGATNELYSKRRGLVAFFLHIDCLIDLENLW